MSTGASAHHSLGPIEAIVFDLGGVLIDWDPRYLYRKLSDDAVRIEQFLNKICHSEWNSQQDAGRPFAVAVAELVATHPEEREWIEAYQNRWEEMISGDIKGTVEILNKLAEKGRYRLFALTNWSSETFPYALRTFPFFRHFEGIVVSGDERTIKPDPKIFQILLDRYRLDAHQCLFIDDVEKNVWSARELGFRAIQFRSSETLRIQLQEHSISL